MAIQLYTVGIYFNKSIAFAPDGKAPNGTATMSGLAILQAAQKLGLGYRLVNGVITQLYYTPDAGSFRPGSDNVSLAGTLLVLNENLATFPNISNVIQYTSSIAPVEAPVGRPPFATNQFFDGSDIRARLLGIYEGATTTIWGVVNSNGTIANSSGGFTVTNVSAGLYTITFTPAFSGVPSITGTQTGNAPTNPSSQNPLDGIEFPGVTPSQVSVVTGDNSGTLQNRNFSFVAIGPTATK